jgi:hypothetical protein
MFIAALFTIVNHGNSQDAPQLMNGLRKCGNFTTEFYSAIKKNAILLFMGKWMELENISLSEVSQVQKAKAKDCMFFPICGI